jgi:putative ABC transport system substrate-binding protein
MDLYLIGRERADRHIDVVDPLDDRRFGWPAAGGAEPRLWDHQLALALSHRERVAGAQVQANRGVRDPAACAPRLPVPLMGAEPALGAAPAVLVPARGYRRRPELTPTHPDGMMPPREGPPMERRGSRWSRRAFVAGTAGLGLVVGCGRLPGQATVQPPAKVARIALLSSVAASPEPSLNYLALLDGLREYGWVEGEHFTLERRYAEHQPARLPDLAAEVVQLNPDIILASGIPAAQAAKDATTTIPIVMTNAADPIGSGIVASLARPGGNVTGLTELIPQLSGKRLELLTATVPGASRIEVLWNPTNASAALSLREAEVAAEALGVQLHSLEVRSADDLDGAFEAAIRERVDALFLLQDPAFANLTPYGKPVLDFAATKRLPAMYFRRELVEAGGLMAYSVSITGMFRRAAYYVDRILKGAKPADLPVEQPMRFDFVVNLKTARELGLTFPNEILLQVTEVIQ